MIKNFLFDFGDIFINLDKQATQKALFKLGVPEISEEIMLVCQQYEKGLMSTDSFVNFFENKFQILSEKLISAWNAILLDFPTHRLKFIQELRINPNYRLFYWIIQIICTFLGSRITGGCLFLIHLKIVLSSFIFLMK
jgi:putative hydrolase of the HAD superfamily